MPMKKISEQMLDTLREQVVARLSPYRAAHTLGVEEMTARLAALYMPKDVLWLRAAALLHDITKEESDKAQLDLFAEHGISLRPDEAATPKIWHAITAPLVIAKAYADFATPALLSAVRWHTTGRRGMTLGEAILYLADYIEGGRKFADCTALRDMFWGSEPAAMKTAEKHCHLRDVLLRSFEMTLADIEKSGGTACLDTLAAVEDLKEKSTLA